MPQDPRARFQITADNSDFKSKVAQSKRDTESFAASVQGALRRGALAAAAAFTATAYGLVRMSNDAAQAADRLAKTSDLLGITTERLVALQLAARRAGSSNDELEKGIVRLQKAIVDASRGITTYQRAFDALKLDPNELKQLTPDEQFEKLGQALANVENKTEQVGIAYDIFGGRNYRLIKTLLTTGRELDKLADDTKAWGNALNRVDARQIERANDAVERAQTATQGIATNIALAVAPIREYLADSFADAAAASQGFRAEINTTLEALVVGANFAANSVRGIELALKGTKLAALSIQETAAGIKPTAGPAGGPNPFRAIGFLARGGDSDGEAAVDRIRAEIDETGRSIDELIGKFQDGDTALAKFRQLQADALANARQSLQGELTGGGLEGDDSGAGLGLGDKEREALAARLEAVRNALRTETEAILAEYQRRDEIALEAFDADLVNEQDRDAIRLQNAQDTADKLLEIERRKEAERRKLNEQTEQAIQAAKEQTANLAVGFLQALGSQNKTFAVAAIILEKALAIKRTLLANRVAAELAFASQLIPGDPTSLARAAAAKATVLAQGAASAALIAATGVVQVASLGSGSTGAPLGTPTNPVYTNGTGSSSAGTNQVQAPQVVINIHGDVNGHDAEEIIAGIRSELENKDVVLFSRNSRQALELQP